MRFPRVLRSTLPRRQSSTRQPKQTMDGWLLARRERGLPEIQPCRLEERLASGRCLLYLWHFRLVTVSFPSSKLNTEDGLP